MNIKRGTIYLADLNPRFGTEPGKTRPVLVLQTNIINNHHPSTVICPMTTKVKKDVQILRVHLKKNEAGLDFESDILLEQIRAIDNNRFKREMGRLSPKRMLEVNEKLKNVLELE